MKCLECNHDFPKRLILAWEVGKNEGFAYRRMCPICGLKFRNQNQGFPPETPFGPKNQAMVEEAKKYLTKGERK